MKYLIFTDLHLSYNSSILPISGIGKYTTRLQMCIDTLEYIFKFAKENKVDKIIFAGDMFNSHTLRAEEITAFSDVMENYYDNNIPMIAITGNHDILDNNSNFYSSSVLDLFDNISIYNSPTKIDTELSVLPYMPFNEITNNLVESIKNKILISHIDMYGSILGSNYTLDFGVQPDLFSGFTKVFNGHIHNQQVLSKNVMNIGSCVSHSFSDDPEYIPGFIIYDSETDEVESFKNPHSILFRSIDTREESLITFVNDCLTDNYRYVLRVITEDKSRVNEILQKHKDKFISYRVITNSINNNATKDTLEQIDINYDNLTLQFEEFLNCQESLKYPIKDYTDVLHEID